MKNTSENFVAIAFSIFIFICSAGCKKNVGKIISPAANNEALAGEKIPGTCPYPCPDPRCEAYSVGCAVDPNLVTVIYGGVPVSYEKNTGLLRFNNVSDLNTVLNQLDANYESYNASYESQYASLTTDQMDSVDDVKNFDEFKPYRDFEAQFVGYSSTRRQLENIENTWLVNSFTGTDPDNSDKTFDDSENTLFNSGYSIKIGTIPYQLTDTGLAVGSGGSNPAVVNTNISNALGCFTNRRTHSFYTFASARYKLKVAINWSLIRTSAKGKVVSFKLKNGKWKRRRSSMAVSVGGSVYDNSCLQLAQFLFSNPSSGYKKRKSLKVKKSDLYPIKYKTYAGQLTASVITADPTVAASLPIQ